MKKSLRKYKLNQKSARSRRVEYIDSWRSHVEGKPLPLDAEKMLRKSLFEHWRILQEAFRHAALIGVDIEQYRDEIRTLVELVQPEDDPYHEKRRI